MAITGLDSLVTALAAALRTNTMEASITAQANQYASLWTAAGSPGAGSTPPTGAGGAPTNATAGAIPYTNPGGSLSGYLARLAVGGTVACSVTVYDRLVATSGLSGTATGAQTVGSTALTRSTSGLGVEAWMEVYGALGATTRTVSISYTNTVPTSGQTSGSITIPASVPAGWTAQFPLAAGDLGVTAVASATLSASTGTAGNFGITLAERICTVPILVADQSSVFDYAQLGLPEITNGACLALRVLCSTTSSGLITTEFAFAQA